MVWLQSHAPEQKGVGWLCIFSQCLHFKVVNYEEIETVSRVWRGSLVGSGTIKLRLLERNWRQ